MNFSIEALLSTLPVMGYGMAGIFVVMIVIALTIALLKKLG